MSKLYKYDWSPYYYIRYKDSNGRYRKISTRTEHKELAEQFKARHDAYEQRPPERDEQTVSNLLDAYLADRKGVVASYDSLFHASKPLKEHYKCQPRHITPLMNKQYISKRRKQGRSDGTIIKELGTLRSALSYGVKNDWIEKAPFIKRPPQPQSRDRWLTEDEVSKLLAACRSPHIKLFINLAVKTGARMTAILELTWDRVSFDKNIIFYPLPDKDHGKKRRAIVPMSPLLRKELLDAYEARLTNWVIEYHGKPIGNPSEAFNAAVKLANIEKCTIHDLRRTCATWLVQKGIPISEIARMLGDTEAMIRKVYGHHSPDYLRNAAEALDW